MFEALREAVEALEVPLDGDALAELSEVADLLAAKLSCAVGEFDAAGSWGLDGATSMTAWLRMRAGMTGSTAKSVVSTARRLRSLPMTAAAWERGALSGGQVQAIVRNAGDDFPEADIVPRLVDLPVAEVAVVMQSWKAESEPPDTERTVTCRRRWAAGGS